MKTLKLKALLIPMLVIIFASFTNVINAGGGGGTKASGDASAVAPAASPNGRFEKENTDIRSDIASISMQNERIKFLKEKYKKDCKAGNKSATIIDRKELCKARADLMRDKRYLAADKRDLVRDHKLALSERRKEIRKDRAALSASNRKHSKDLAKGNVEAAQQSALLVIQHQNELKYDKAALRRDRLDMNENLLAVNKEIKKSDGQFIIVTATENTVARVDNWITK